MLRRTNPPNFLSGVPIPIRHGGPLHNELNTLCKATQGVQPEHIGQQCGADEAIARLTRRQSEATPVHLTCSASLLPHR